MVSDCREIKPILSKIWQIFRSIGITSDLEILECLALILLAYHTENADIYRSLSPDVLALEDSSDLSEIREEIAYHLKVDKSLVPEPPRGLTNEKLRLILEQLETVFSGRSLAKLYNECIIPSLEEMQAGGRYATPRHITRWMAQLVQLKDGEALADFACGSGGFLVASENVQPRVTGIEISPNWARLACANVVLHGLPDPIIRVGNTFVLLGYPPHQKEFDCVLMNPPFGEVVDPSLVSKAFGGRVSGRSETLLSALAYEVLKPGGRMAVMLPSGSLFANGSGEQILRDTFLENNALKAVISLPKDANQPYITLPIHVLFVQNNLEDEPIKWDKVWFYRARYDGLTSGRNRQPKPENNDLPIIEAAINNQVRQREEKIDGARVTLLFAERETIGYSFISDNKTAFKVNRLLSFGSGLTDGFLVDANSGSVGELILIYGENVLSGISEAKQVSFELPNNYSLRGYYNFLDEEMRSYRIYFEDDQVEIRKENSVEASYSPSSQLENGGTFSILVDKKGFAISPLFRLQTDTWINQATFPTVLDLTDTQDEIVARLVLFSSDGVFGAELFHSAELKMYLFRNEKQGIAFTYMPILKEFFFSHVEEAFSTDEKLAGAMFDRHGDLLGVAVHTTVILQAKTRDLQSSTYWPIEKSITVGLRSPVEILANIKINQNRLNDGINRLMGIAELQLITGGKLPPILKEIRELPGGLRGTQKLIWQEIEKMIELVPGQDYLTPKPFQADDIQISVPTADVQLTLDLFERMGMLVQVSYADVPYYRLLAEKDIVRVSI